MIASLGGVEYFEGQCLAFLKNPQTNPQNEQYIPGVFSYQENKISFSFMVSGEIKEIHSLQYQTLYIVDNKKRYTLYKPYNRIILDHVLGYPIPIIFYYEWLFDDHIDPNKIKGECFVCRTNYLESFFTTKKHLLPDALFKVDKSGCESYHENNDKDFILQSFYIQNDFLSQRYEKDKIKAKSNLIPKRQNRLLTYQCDLSLECNIIFETLEKLALIAEAIKNFFILIYAHSNFDIQIDYIQFKLSNKDITAIRNTYKKDKKSMEIDPYGIAIQFQQIDNFSVILEKWIDFCIKDGKDFQLESILDIINKKDPIIHLYSDMFVLISMIESFLKKPTRKKLHEELSEFFKFSLSRTKCDQTKNYFNDKCQDLIKQIVDCRNSLAHGKDLKLDTNKATDISHAFIDFKQIVIEYFFGEIGLSGFIIKNFGFLNKVKLRNPQKTEKITESNR
ncbi:HEPN domain-containing protein [Helicobacter pylori]|uniref:HEPN domain-containing protein n=1 Tax=Helicobacter pylori TaxID=210 RepID=UPI0018D01E9C|nr:hypothetical protein [Helicobacter pylori]